MLELLRRMHAFWFRKIKHISLFSSQGIVDHHFKIVRSLKEATSPFFFAELISTYCSDARLIIKELTNSLYISLLIYMMMFLLFV